MISFDPEDARPIYTELRPTIIRRSPRFVNYCGMTFRGANQFIGVF
jgi:hypothetical protein